MHRRPEVLVMVALIGLAARAEPSQCLGTGRSQLIVDNTLGVSLSPDGPENQLKALLCQPLIKKPGILFDYSSWDIGIFNYLSPVYDLQGVTVGLVPISILELRLDAAAVGMWALPLDGAGYFALPGYTPFPTEKNLPRAMGRSAYGANVTFSTRLQGEVPVFNDVLVFSNTFQLDYWYLGDGSHYLNLKRDVVLARSDLLVKNIAFLAFKVKASRTVNLQFGVQDDLTFVPASNQVGNIIGAFLSVPIRREGTLRDLEPFLRLGAYTHHPSRTGFQVQLGLSLTCGVPVGAGRAPQAHPDPEASERASSSQARRR